MAFNEPGVPRGGASSLGTVFIGDDDDDDGGGGLAACWDKVENLGCERVSGFTPLNVNIKEFISTTLFLMISLTISIKELPCAFPSINKSF